MPRMTVDEVAQLVQGRLVRGDAAQALYRVQPLDKASDGSLSFVSKTKYLAHLKDTKASAVFLSAPMIKKAQDSISKHVAVIEVGRPYVAFARAAQAFAPRTPQPEGIHSSSVIDPSATVGADVSIGPFVYVGPQAVVGEAAVLYPGVHIEAGAKVGPATVLFNHVVIRHGCQLGARCIIHPGVVIGSDGFGFAQDPGEQAEDLAKLEHVKIPQVGDVVIEDDVEIGSNSCVDRGALGTTKIMSGTKVDNLVQIGHNVEIGRNCIIVAQSGVAGSSRLESGVTVAAQAGIAGHITIGEGALVYGQSGVAQNVSAGKKVMGTPSIPAGRFFRNSVHFAQLSELVARVKKLEKQLKSEDK
jgi:UDP-3-O-[3-hydroxymyristoyl] glucosamine N-acyltransferase